MRSSVYNVTVTCAATRVQLLLLSDQIRYFRNTVYDRLTWITLLTYCSSLPILLATVAVHPATLSVDASNSLPAAATGAAVIQYSESGPGCRRPSWSAAPTGPGRAAAAAWNRVQLHHARVRSIHPIDSHNCYNKSSSVADDAEWLQINLCRTQSRKLLCNCTQQTV